MTVRYPTFFKDDQFQIQIQHIPTREKVEFHSWITNFSDAFSSAWSGTPVYGRMDDLYTFQKTSRVISLGFDVIASSYQEARQNQTNLNTLTQFLYPVYSNPIAGGSSRENSQVLQAAPLLKMKYNSVVSDAGSNGELVGFLNGLVHQPDLASGQFFAHKGTTKDILYQTYRVALNFTVLHTHLTGWVEKTSTFDGEGNKTTNYSFGSGTKPELQRNFPRPNGFKAPGAPTLAPAPPFRDAPPTSVQTLPQEAQDQIEALGSIAQSNLNEQTSVEEGTVLEK